MKQPISVGLGEQVISRDEEDILVAFGLGSCLGIGMVDPHNRISGLIHCVLPEHGPETSSAPAKYVDTGIEGLWNAMLKAGADPWRILVRMAGGANMLIPLDKGAPFDIGTRNIQSAHRTFDRLRLRLQGEEVGGNTGRTVRLYVRDGRMTVRMIGGKEFLI
jgi:chemotaxis protein CheD